MAEVSPSACPVVRGAVLTEEQGRNQAGSVLSFHGKVPMFPDNTSYVLPHLIELILNVLFF